MGWPVGEAPQDSNVIHISTTSFGCNEKGADSVSQGASGPASARRQTPRRHHNPPVVEGKAANNNNNNNNNTKFI